MGGLWAAAPVMAVLSPDELHIWRVRLIAPADVSRRLRAHLSPDELERAARFVFAPDRERFVLARGYLRQILGAYLGLSPASLQFAYNVHGKPSLAQQPAGAALSFNLAHSGDLALYAVARGRRVGVDIERVRLDLDYPAILSGVFTAREQAALATLPEDQRRLAFFNGWARKEAYLKARGQGLSYPPDRVEVTLLPGEPVAFNLPGDEAAASTWALYALDAGAGYTAAVAIEGSAPRLRLYRWGEA
jgi:4'-phosphopantetheinyl transferase